MRWPVRRRREDDTVAFYPGMNGEKGANTCVPSGTIYGDDANGSAMLQVDVEDQIGHRVLVTVAHRLARHHGGHRGHREFSKRNSVISVFSVALNKFNSIVS